MIVIAFRVRESAVQSQLTRGGDTWTTLGRPTALVSANLLLHPVPLMGCVPIFERGLGRDRMARMHRLVGFLSFWLQSLQRDLRAARVRADRIHGESIVI